MMVRPGEFAAALGRLVRAEVLVLKANHDQAHRIVSEHFGKSAGSSYAMTEENLHGRYEKRECWVEEDFEFFDKSWKWQGLRCSARIRRETCRPGNHSNGNEATVEDPYYPCSTPPDAESILGLVRRHWGIETVATGPSSSSSARTPIR